MSTSLKMKQIVIAQFQDAEHSGPLSYSVYALGEDGVVYRFDPKCEGWIAWPMRPVGCRTTHKARR